MSVSVHSEFVHPLSQPGGDVSLLGGKGESLVRLTEAGFNVPDGFCLTTDAYAAFVAANGLGDVITQLTRRLDAVDRMAAERASGIITTGFEAGDVPSSVVNQLREGYAGIGYGRVAVRSSATAEDLPTGSFAGQQDSFLDIGDTASLVDAVRRCWASAWSPRAMVYRARQGFAAADVAVAVIVQRMVNAQAAGVMFTVDPVSGLDSAITINSAWGLGEAVVGGDVSPDTVVVDRRSGKVTKQRTGTKNAMTVRAAGGTVLAPVPEHLRHRPSLSKIQALRLARTGRRIEALFQQPVDVEWCRTDTELFILQARPVTARRRADPWNDSYRGDFLWTNTNVGEAIPDVMTPASWSMVQVFLTDAMATASIPPYVGYGRIGGHIYLNVSVMKTLSGVVGVNERHFRALTEEVFGYLPDDVEIPPVPASWAKVLTSVLPVGLHVLSEARRDVRKLDDYFASHPELCARRRREITAVRDPGELARLWSSTLEPEFHKASLMLSAATRSSGASFVATRKRLQAMVGPAGANAVTAGLGDAGQLASMDLLTGLDQLEAGRIDEATFNERYGHRGPHEFEISLPRSGEDPGWLRQQRAQRTPEVNAELATRQKKQAQVRQLAWIRLGHRFPVQAWLLRRQVSQWGEIARNRELARSEVIRYFWVLRAFVVRAGELTGLGDDIFFLDLAEILEALQGEVLDADEIAHRRQVYQAYVALPPLPGLIRGRFDPFAWAKDPRDRVDPRASRSRTSGGHGGGEVTVTGFPGSAGVVEGTARVILAPADGTRLKPGEVLVTNVTNVGWTPLFPRAAAVVTNVGAPLSHAAIVARELGIPAVVGCGDATAKIADGDRVRVDGSGGRITVLRS